MFERSEAILTTLEQYRNLQKVFATPAADDKPIGIEQYFAYMELLYRIQVLECFRNLEQTAPVSAIGLHRTRKYSKPATQQGRRFPLL